MSSLLRMLSVVGALALVAGCGSDGVDGANGDPGADGTPGTDGSNGTDGTDGTNGTNGTDGSDGIDGTDGVDTTPSPTVQCTLCHDSGSLADVEMVHEGLDPGRALAIEITDFAANGGGNAVVSFTVWDDDTNQMITNLDAGDIGNLRVMINEHIPGSGGDKDLWTQAHHREDGDDGSLINYGDGSYDYIFTDTIANLGGTAGRVQQVSIRLRRFFDYNSVNDVYQTTDLPTTGNSATEVSSPVGEVVLGSNCDTCHGDRFGGGMHGGSYYNIQICTNCHAPGDTGDRYPDMEEEGKDLVTMVHQIHAAIDNSAVTGGEDWSHVTYPQEVNNCRKCHAGATDGDLWNTQPTIEACSSCHNTLDITSAGTTHVAGQQTDNTGCAGGSCHGSATNSPMAQHASDNVTPNNPELPAGAVSFRYTINSVTADGGGIATVNFTLEQETTPGGGYAAITDLLTTYPPTNFTGGPNFKLAYSLPQDGIDEPADWNNLGENKAQPISYSLADVITAGGLSTADSGATYDAVLTAVPFPANSTMRAVAMDGYFTQTNLAANLARHAPSPLMAVDGDDERRAILDFNGCLDCHERLELHGGNRVIAAETDTDSVAVCIMCHNPNLSSSGNTFDYADYVANPGNYNSSSVATVTNYGTDPFAWPEAAQNFKDLVHGIHGSGVRGTPYEHVRIRGGNAYSYDWSHVSFPGDASNCSKCHDGDSYLLEEIPAEALMSTSITGVPTTQAEALAVRDSLPNDDDTVIDAGVAACRACHESEVLDAHVDQFGAKLGFTRFDVLNP